MRTNTTVGALAARVIASYGLQCKTQQHSSVDDDAEARAKAGFYRAQLMLTQIGIKFEITVIEH